jgi:hypothetical protein
MSKLSNLEFFRIVVASGDAGSEESRFIYPPAIAKTLGFKLIEVGLGTATIEILTDPEKHANPMGTTHGGVLCDIVSAPKMIGKKRDPELLSPRFLGARQSSAD